MHNIFLITLLLVAIVIAIVLCLIQEILLDDSHEDDGD